MTELKGPTSSDHQGLVHRLEEAERALKRRDEELRELTRTARNGLSSIRAVVRLMRRTAVDKETYAMHLEGRIDALARSQVNALGAGTAGVDLGLLVADEIAAVVGPLDDRVGISGPPTRLLARAAEPLGLVLHELATNSGKFGALARPDGHLTVTWVESATGVELRWHEPDVGAPAGGVIAGFGFEMVSERLPYELGALTAIGFVGRDLVCTILLPAAVLVPRETARAAAGGGDPSPSI